MSNMTLSLSQADRTRVAEVDVRALPQGGALGARPGTTVAPATGVWGTTLPAYTHIVDDVRMGAFPGVLAWSPPRPS